MGIPTPTMGSPMGVTLHYFFSEYGAPRISPLTDHQGKWTDNWPHTDDKQFTGGEEGDELERGLPAHELPPGKGQRTAGG